MGHNARPWMNIADIASGAGLPLPWDDGDRAMPSQEPPVLFRP